MIETVQEGPSRADGLSIDVVVPCYNYGRFLRSCVASVLSQDVRVRVLVIDDCSTDETEAVGLTLAAEDRRVTFVRHETNRGHIQTYNEGIAWAGSDLFLVLSADDMMMPGALERAAMAMAANPDMGMVYGRGLHFDDGLAEAAVLAGEVSAAPFIDVNCYARPTQEGRTVRETAGGDGHSVRVMQAPEFYGRSQHVTFIPACSVVTRTALQKRLGGYRPELPHAGDFEMWLRLSLYGTVGYIDAFQTAVRHHGRNMHIAAIGARDIIQRIDCLKALKQDHGDMLPQGPFGAICRSLADDALRDMWRCQKAGDGQAARDLLAAAREVDPGIVLRPIWYAYNARRLVGPAIWCRFGGVKDSFRRITVVGD